MEKWKPTYDLFAFQKLADHVLVTTNAVKTAAALGLVRSEMVATIRTIEKGHFYNSVASVEPQIWQDVYHLPSLFGTLHVQFVEDMLTDFRSLLIRGGQALPNAVDPDRRTVMRRDVRPLTLTYGGKSITVELPGWYGDCQEEGVLEPKDMRHYDRAANLLKARVEGLLEPSEIRRIRKKLGLSQEAAGNNLDGGRRAFGRYESGDCLPSRAISIALLLLDRGTR